MTRVNGNTLRQIPLEAEGGSSPAQTLQPLAAFQYLVQSSFCPLNLVAMAVFALRLLHKWQSLPFGVCRNGNGALR